MALFVIETHEDGRQRLRRLTCEMWDWDYRRPLPTPEQTDAPQEIPAFLRRPSAPASDGRGGSD